MGEQQAEFAERTVDILESKIDNLQETLYKEKLNYRIWLNNIEMKQYLKSVLHSVYHILRMIIPWYGVYHMLHMTCYYNANICQLLSKRYFRAIG